MSAGPSTLIPRLREAAALREELANSLTHGCGLALSLAGLPILIWLSWTRGTVWHLVSCAVYGSTLVLLYASSTAYHSCRSENWKRVFQIFDHSAIYLLIAGTYTPFTLITLRGPWGWTLFGLAWTICVVGVLLKALAAHRFLLASYVMYVVMGWMVVVALKPLLAHLTSLGVEWLFAGGIAYTAGLVFFAWDTLPFNHAIWHVFVLAGSACHYMAVITTILPRAR